MGLAVNYELCLRLLSRSLLPVLATRVRSIEPEEGGLSEECASPNGGQCKGQAKEDKADATRAQDEKEEQAQDPTVECGSIGDCAGCLAEPGCDAWSGDGKCYKSCLVAPMDVPCCE